MNHQPVDAVRELFAIHQCLLVHARHVACLCELLKRRHVESARFKPLQLLRLFLKLDTLDLAHFKGKDGEM